MTALPWEEFQDSSKSTTQPTSPNFKKEGANQFNEIEEQEGPWKSFSAQQDSQQEIGPWTTFQSQKKEEISKEEKDELDVRTATNELLAGAQRAIAPSTVDVKGREDVSGAKIVGELGTTIAGGIAAAKVGSAVGAAISGPAAPVGAAVGAIVGGVAWGLYTGLGQHLLREKEIAYDKGNKEEAKKMTFVDAFEKNPTGALTEIATNINPALNSASKAMRIVRAVGQVAAEGAKEASYEDSSKESVAISAALGLIPGAIIMVPRTNTPSLKALNKLRTDAKVAAEGIAEMPQSVQQKLMNEINQAKNIPIELDNEDFQHWFVRMAGDTTSGDIARKFETHSARYNESKMKDMWDAFNSQKILTDEAHNQIHEIHAEMARMGTKGAPYGSVAGKFVPPRFLARQIDRVFNLNLANDIDKVSEGSSRTAFLINKHGRDIEKAAKLRKKLGISGEEFMIALEAGEENLKKGPVKGLSESVRNKILTEEGMSVLTDYRDKFNELHDYWKEHGYNVGFLKNYVPMYAKRGAEAATAIRKRYDLFKQNKLNFKEKVEFATSLGQIVGDPKFVQKDSDGTVLMPTLKEMYIKYEEAITELLDSQGRGKQSIQLTAAMEREGKVPSWLREKDIDKVLQGYVAHNIKSIELGDVLLQLRQKADILQEVGMDNAANDIRKYIGDQLGPDSTVMWNAFVKRNKFIADELLENQDRTVWDTTKAYGRLAIPEVISFLHTSYYNGALVLNVRAHVRNLVQSYFTTAPELQGIYGYSAVTKGFWRLARDIKNIKGTLEEINELGLNGGLVREFERDIDGLSKFRKINQKISDLLMASYSLTDGINRAGTLRTAEVVAEDLLNNNKGAWSWVEKLNRRDPGKASLMRELIQKNDKEGIKIAIARDLVAKTQFHYGRTQLSEMQRSLGKLTSMFTTWPAMTAGELYDSARGSGSLGKMTKDNWHRFVAPLGFIMVANTIYDRVTDKDAKKVKQYTLGNPLELGQLYAVSDISFLNNPIIQFGGKFATEFFDFTKTIADGESGSTTDALESLGSMAGKQVMQYHLPVFSSIYNEARRIDKAFSPTAAGKLKDDKKSLKKEKK